MADPSVIIVIGEVDQQHVIKAEQELARRGTAATVVRVNLRDARQLNSTLDSVCGSFLHKQDPTLQRELPQSFKRLCNQMVLASYGYDTRDVWAVLISEAAYERLENEGGPGEAVGAFFGPPYKYERRERPFMRLKHYCVVRRNEVGPGEWLDDLEKRPR